MNEGRPGVVEVAVGPEDDPVAWPARAGTWRVVGWWDRCDCGCGRLLPRYAQEADVEGPVRT